MKEAMATTTLALDHTGVTVSDLGRSVKLWRDVLGFELTRTFELTGDFAAGLTGRPGAHTKHAILSHGRRLVELVEYVSPVETETFRPRPCDVGSVHVALTVADIDAALAALAALGCVAVCSPKYTTPRRDAGAHPARAA